MYYLVTLNSCYFFSLLENYVLIALVVQGNTNFQGILDWILQILHYYCRKQHKFIKNSWIIEQNLVLCLPFFLFTANCASWRLPHRQSFFKFPPRILNVSSDHSCCIWFRFLVWKWSKFSQLDITACIKNCVCNWKLCFQFTLLFHVSKYKTSMQIFLFVEVSRIFLDKFLQFFRTSI